MTTEEIKVIKFKIDIVKQCQVEMGVTSPIPNQYFQGMLDAYNEILHELGGIKSGKKTLQR
jgi:hypothetical protein